jgi:hypothetical protein
MLTVVVTPVIRAVIMGGLCIGAAIRMKSGTAIKTIYTHQSLLSPRIFHGKSLWTLALTVDAATPYGFPGP